MLGYALTEGRGAGDLLLAEVAAVLRADGWPLAGAVQVNRPGARPGTCLMELALLGSDVTIPISQDLGPLSRGCRVDPAGMAAAVGLAEAALAHHPRLLIVNKFGKHEAEGGGFRPLIGQALMQGVPVLTTLSPRNRTAFEAFADGLAEPLPGYAEALLAWCRATAGQPRPM